MAKKNQHLSKLKQIKIRANIDKNDLQIKASKCDEFLKNGNKVRISMRLYGRQLEHKDEYKNNLLILNSLIENKKEENPAISSKKNLFEILITPK